MDAAFLVAGKSDGFAKFGNIFVKHQLDLNVSDGVHHQTAAWWMYHRQQSGSTSFTGVETCYTRRFSRESSLIEQVTVLWQTDCKIFKRGPELQMCGQCPRIRPQLQVQRPGARTSNWNCYSWGAPNFAVPIVCLGSYEAPRGKRRDCFIRREGDEQVMRWNVMHYKGARFTFTGDIGS